LVARDLGQLKRVRSMGRDRMAVGDGDVEGTKGKAKEATLRMTEGGMVMVTGLAK
jgi:hypothetical protein